MKKFYSYSILSAAFLAAFQLSTFGAEEGATGAGHKPMARKDAMLVSLTAKVTAIDPASREITLKGPLGNEETLIVEKSVKRFNEIKVGDNVTADYYVSIAAELRKPTPEEEKSPLMYLDAGGKASTNAPPAAGGMRHLKAVTTVEGLDRPSQTVTVKGPLGHYHTVRVEDPSNLSKMHIGDTIVVTYTEAMAISLEKVHKKSGE